jgi:uncharacterized RDD family membrane protein YckC
LLQRVVDYIREILRPVHPPPGRELTSLVRRQLAYVVDILPLVLLAWAYLWLYTDYPELYRKFYTQRDLPLADHSEYFLVRARARRWLFTAWAFYSIVWESTIFRAGPGKLLFGLEVVDEHGAPVTFRRTVRRNITKFSSLGLCGLGIAWCVFDRYKRPLHDVVAKTFVVRRL